MNAIDNAKVTPLDRVELSKTFILKDPYLYAITEFLNYLIELLDYVLASVFLNFEKKIPIQVQIKVIKYFYVPMSSVSLIDSKLRLFA